MATNSAIEQGSRDLNKDIRKRVRQLVVQTAGLGAVTFVVRTILEDRTLQVELEGYREYTAQVKYRLLPGVW